MVGDSVFASVVEERLLVVLVNGWVILFFIEDG